MVAQFSSDWVYRGTTETAGEPSLGLNIEWQATPTVFFGLETHQAREVGDRQRQRSVMAYIGSGFELSENWFATATIAHREYPGSTIEWDFTELGIDVSHSSGLGFALDYSPNYYEHDTPSIAAELRYSKRLVKRAYWYAELGAVELTAKNTFDDHQYAALGLGGSVRTFNLDIAYRWNSLGSDGRFGQAEFSPSQFVFQLSYRIR